MCNAYKRIVELCSPRVWKPEILLKLLCLPKPCAKLIECIRLVVDKSGQSFLSSDDRDDGSSLLAKSEGLDLPKVGQKRIALDEENSFPKRLKMTEPRFSSGSFMVDELSAGVGQELEKDHGCDFRVQLYSLINCLSPDNHMAYPLEPAIAIQVLSLLCLSLSVYPKTNLFSRISKQVLSWIPWICKQVGGSRQRSF